MALLFPDLFPQHQYGGDVAASYNALHKNALDNALKQMQGQYYGPATEAEIGSKNAYTNWVGPQSMMAYLQSPGVAQSMTPEKYKELINITNEASTNAFNNARRPNNANNTTNPLGLLGWVAQKLGFMPSGNELQQQPQGLPPPPSSAPAPGVMPGGNAARVQGATIPPSQATATQAPTQITGATPSGIPETAAGNMAQGLKTQNEAGGLNQPAIFNAEEAGMKQYNQGQLANIIEQQNKIYSEDNVKANEAYSQNVLLDSMTEEYKKLGEFEKGNWTKIYDKPLSNAAMVLDAKTEQLVQSVAKNAASTGSITDATRISAAASKTGRKFSDDAFKTLVKFAKAQNERTQEKPLFDQTFSKLGYSPQQTEILWRYYNTRKPFYNSKNKNAHDDNLNSWDTFYSNKNKTDNLRAAFSPSAQKEINKSYKKNEEPQYYVVTAAGKKMAHGSESNVDKFLKANKGYKKVPFE